MNIIARQTISLWVTFTHIEPLLKVSLITRLDYSFFIGPFVFNCVELSMSTPRRLTESYNKWELNY